MYALAISLMATVCTAPNASDCRARTHCSQLAVTTALALSSLRPAHTYPRACSLPYLALGDGAPACLRHARPRSALLSHWACRGHFILPPPTHLLLSLLLLPLLPPPHPPSPPPQGRRRTSLPPASYPPGPTQDAEIVNDRLATRGIVAAVGYSRRGESRCVCVGGGVRGLSSRCVHKCSTLRWPRTQRLTPMHMPALTAVEAGQTNAPTGQPRCRS